MRKCFALSFFLCFWLGIECGSTPAQLRIAARPECSSAMMDVSALPGSTSFSYGIHLFVLEFHNIASTACSLTSPQLALMPTSDTNNQPFFGDLRPGDPGYVAVPRPQVLESGAWAHVILVWSSQAGPELSCDQYSELRAGFEYEWQKRDLPGIVVRNLWIRACGPFAYSAYRPGRYTKESPIPSGWLNWYSAGVLPRLTPQLPTPGPEVATASHKLQLSAQAKRTMVGDRLFKLKLNFPRLLDGGCAFSQMRKRESDGSTVIAIQQCDTLGPEKTTTPLAVPRYHQPGVMELVIGNLDFTPKHFGPLEYDILAPVGRAAGKNGRIQYASTRVDLVARDPTLPQQTAILNALPPCAKDQLQVDALPAVVFTALKTLRAYNATNTSPQPCSLAGVPRTRGIDEKGDYQVFLPPACPNCANELFVPRPNGRIDLKHGETAHLLTGATGNGTGYCSFTPKLELSFNRDASPAEPMNIAPLPAQIEQSAYLPFEAHDCVSIDISAWRQGAYDGDPLNRRNVTKSSQTTYPVQAASVPPECDKPDLLVHGQPHFVEGMHDPEYALSMEGHKFVKGEAVPLYIWTDNSGDSAIQFDSCTNLGNLKAGMLVIYDAYGHRMLNKRQIATEEQCQSDPVGYHGEPLRCSGLPIRPLSAHTCASNRIDLTREYELPPGEYSISTRDPGDYTFCPRPDIKPHNPTPATDISFEVLQP